MEKKQQGSSKGGRMGMLKNDVKRRREEGERSVQDMSEHEKSKNGIFLVLVTEENLQLPNFNGQACASMGKSSSCMGHSAEMVNLWGSKKKTCIFFFLCTFPLGPSLH